MGIGRSRDVKYGTLGYEAWDTGMRKGCGDANKAFLS